MDAKSVVALLFFAMVGCQPKLETENSRIDATVYQIVLRDLAGRPSEDAYFQGETIWVDPTSCKGDSLFYSWGSEISVAQDLQTALKTANQQTIDFDAKELASPKVQIKEIESFHDLFYYGKGKGPTEAKSLVQFWRAGFSVDGQRAVVRFYFGPSPHGAAGTYVLQLTKSGWTIVASTLSYYV